MNRTESNVLSLIAPPCLCYWAVTTLITNILGELTLGFTSKKEVYINWINSAPLKPVWSPDSLYFMPQCTSLRQWLHVVGEYSCEYDVYQYTWLPSLLKVLANNTECAFKKRSGKKPVMTPVSWTAAIPPKELTAGFLCLHFIPLAFSQWPWKNAETKTVMMPPHTHTHTASYSAEWLSSFLSSCTLRSPKLCSNPAKLSTVLFFNISFSASDLIAAHKRDTSGIKLFSSSWHCLRKWARTQVDDIGCAKSSALLSF